MLQGSVRTIAALVAGALVVEAGAPSPVSAQAAHANPLAPPAGVVPRDDIDSRRILELLRRIRSEGKPAALRDFWTSISREHSPIIEQLPGEPSSVLATFVYRDTTGAPFILLGGGFAGFLPSQQAMKHEAGTDLWYLSVRLPSDVRAGYVFLRPMDLVPFVGQPSASPPERVTDPFNPNVDSAQAPVSVILGPKADRQPWTVERADVPHGHLEVDTIPSSFLAQSRRVWLYTPPGLATRQSGEGGDIPLLVLFDGGVYTRDRGVPTATILDNLIAARRISPVVAVLVDDSYGDPSHLEPRTDGLAPTQRTLDLVPNAAFADFVALELVPWARGRAPVVRTPLRTVVGGSSLGALTASYVAIRHPEVFGGVISQSGSYWWAPPGEEDEWLTRSILTLPHQPVRFYVEVGKYEPGFLGVGQVIGNRHFRDMLRARQYDVVYSEFPGGHAYLDWRGTLSNALEYFFGDRR